MAMIFIDRRKSSKGKSSANRKKLLKRIRNYIKIANPTAIGSKSVSNQNGIGKSPVKVAAEALLEPCFMYFNDGENVIVVTGNEHFDRGDELPVGKSDSEDSSSGPGAGQDLNDEDDFIIDVAKDEFLEIFFEDCELPNLTTEKWTEKLENESKHAGFSVNGNPSQLSVIKSYKNSLSRRIATLNPYKTEIEELKAESEELLKCARPFEDHILERLSQIEAKIVELEAKKYSIPFFDNRDLRYRRKESQPLKTVDAVLFMLMDISGSMGQHEKTIARRWFALLYAFIKRKYNSTDLIFIAHTDKAYEMSEDDFFSTRMSGGTSVSPALAMANKIIKERFDPNETNIYISHASDGDNWYIDNQSVLDEMVGSGKLINKLQFFNYIEVGTRWNTESELWSAYSMVKDKKPSHMTMITVEDTNDVYPMFKKVFGI